MSENGIAIFEGDHLSHLLLLLLDGSCISIYVLLHGHAILALAIIAIGLFNNLHFPLDSWHILNGGLLFLFHNSDDGFHIWNCLGLTVEDCSC